jgi:hypothetical protein
LAFGAFAFRKILAVGTKDFGPGPCAKIRVALQDIHTKIIIHILEGAVAVENCVG